MLNVYCVQSLVLELMGKYKLNKIYLATVTPLKVHGLNKK